MFAQQALKESYHNSSGKMLGKEYSLSQSQDSLHPTPDQQFIANLTPSARITMASINRGKGGGRYIIGNGEGSLDVQYIDRQVGYLFYDHSTGETSVAVLEPNAMGFELQNAMRRGRKRDILLVHIATVLVRGEDSFRDISLMTLDPILDFGENPDPTQIITKLPPQQQDMVRVAMANFFTVTDYAGTPIIPVIEASSEEGK